MSRPPWISIVACLGASVLVAGGCGIAYASAQSSIAHASAVVKAAVNAPATCIGAPAQLPNSGCSRPYAVTSLTDPTFAATDIGKGVRPVDTCKQSLADSGVIACDVGDQKDPSTVVALVGDSHAGQFLEALDLYGRTHKIEFITYLKTLCAGTGSPVVSSINGNTAADIQSCAVWGQRVLSTISADSRISSVLFTNFTSTYLGPTVRGLHRPLASSDFLTAWHGLISAGKHVVAIRDTPNADGVNVPQCVADHLRQYDPCATPLASAQLSPTIDPMLQAVNQLPGVKLIDLTDNFCDPTNCHSVIGGLIVYFDDEHLTSTFSRTLAPIIGADVSKAITGAEKTSTVK